MKKKLILLIFNLLFACAEKDNVPPAQKVRTIGAEWKAAEGGAGGLKVFDSFKNYQYTFEVAADNQEVVIVLSSAVIDVQFALFDTLGRQIRNTNASRSTTETFTLNAGKYRLAICAARQAVGAFSFTIKGINTDPIRIESQILQSGTQNWGPLGGGGYYKTFKNHFYTFDVTDENSSLDIELKSADTNVGLVLYNDLGQAIGGQNGDRYEYLVGPVKKGTYTAMVCTNERGGIGNYSMNIFGKIKNLQKITSQSTEITGNWPTINSFDTYSLELTANNSPLDIELAAVNVNVSIFLQTDSGSEIAAEGNYFFNVQEVLISKDLPKGKYRIKVKPFNYQPNSNGTGNYSLKVFGQFTNFKKL